MSSFPIPVILVAEVLAAKIRSDPGIEGLPLRDSCLKLNQFADDLTCFLSKKSSLSVLLSVLSEFQTWSGLVTNKAKSKILIPSQPSPPINVLEGIPVVPKIKILGLWFEADETEEGAYNMNFRHILDRIKQICGTWSNRVLSLKGKVTVINSLLASLLQYPTAAIFTPHRVDKEYKKILTPFFLNNKPAKIAYKTLILPIDRGGGG